MSTPLSPVSRINWDAAFAVYYEREERRQSAARFIREELARSPDLQSVSPHAIVDAAGVPCSQILNNLYIGNSRSFIETTHLLHALGDLNTSNPRGFKRVVTMCPLEAIRMEHATILTSDTLRDDLQREFQRRGIAWSYIGRGLIDNPEHWPSLFYGCTAPDDPLNELEYPLKAGRVEAERFYDVL